MDEDHAVYRSADGFEYWITCDGVEIARKSWTKFGLTKLNNAPILWIENTLREHRLNEHPTVD